jgi:hypothetical protein
MAMSNLGKVLKVALAPFRRAWLVVFGVACLFSVPGGAVLWEMARRAMGWEPSFAAETVCVAILSLVPGWCMLSPRGPIRATGWAITLMGYAAVAHALSPGRDIAGQMRWLIFAAVAGAVAGLLGPYWGAAQPRGTRGRAVSGPGVPTDARPASPRLQIRLRRLLVLVAVIAVILGFFSRQSGRLLTQRRVAAWVVQSGGQALYDTDRENPPLVISWLDHLLGRNTREPLACVELPPSANDEDLAQLVALGAADLPDLQRLDLFRSQVTEAGLASLKEFSHLRQLMVDGVPVTRQCLRQLKDVPQLTDLWFINGAITDFEVADLAQFRSLHGLGLWNVLVSDAGLAYLKPLDGLVRLDLIGTGVTDAGLAHLKSLPNLETLNVSQAAFTDAGIEHIKQMPRLKRVYLENAGVTPAGIEALRKARPDLEVID